MSRKFKNADEVEECLDKIAKAVANRSRREYRHADQEWLPEWTGADVRITSDFAWRPANIIDGQDLVVRTQHAGVLTWLFMEIRDAFRGHLTKHNKHGFYGSLAQVAQKHLAANQPESDDPRPLLKVVLAEGFKWLSPLREDGQLPKQPGVITISESKEGVQKRINPAE